MHDILVAGHYVHDIIIRGGRKTETLGGPPAHICSFLKPLGLNINVVSKVGRDFRYSNHPSVIAPVKVKSQTTCHIIDYSGNEHASRFLSVCDPILPEDLDCRAKIGIVSGNIGEVLPETILKMDDLCEIIVADVQGFIRYMNAEGKVFHKNLSETSYRKILSKIDFLKANRREASYINTEIDRKNTKIIVTQGEQGCVIIDKEKEIHVPGFPSNEIDSTGAGDAFLAGFAYGLVKRKTKETSAKIGNLFGSISVKQLGVPVISETDIKTVLNLAELS